MAEVGDKLVDLKSLKVVLSAFLEAIYKMIDSMLANTQNGNVDVVCQLEHHTDYTKNTLEFVTDSNGKVTNVYFMSE